MNLVLYSAFLGLLIAATSADAQAAYNQSSVVEVFNGDWCIPTANNVVGMVVDYIALPGGRPNEAPDAIYVENGIAENIVFIPPVLANTLQSTTGDVIAQVLPVPGPTTIVETFTLNGVNYRMTLTIAVGGYCDNLPSTTTPAATTAAY